MSTPSADAPPPPAIYLTTRDVADLIGVKHTDTVCALIERGFLPCARRRVLGGGRTSYRPTVAEVADYLDAYDRALLPALRARWPQAFSADVPQGTNSQHSHHSRVSR